MRMAERKLRVRVTQRSVSLQINAPDETIEQPQVLQAANVLPITTHHQHTVLKSPTLRTIVNKSLIEKEMADSS
jgi:hypothetical protein